jgi:hypothetical protein
MNPRTKTLFHFTKSLDVLMQILKEGFWPQYSLEDITWLGVPNKSKMAVPMVSFCDIPISRLQKHTINYGNYAVGLCRERWSATGLNPVFYISPDSMVKALLRELLLETSKNPNPRSRTTGMVTLANCKSLAGKNLDEDFYSECEWRFFPWVEGVGGENKYNFLLSEEEFRDEQIRKEANLERRKNRMLEFYPDDVRYLLVKTKTEVPMLINFIETNLSGYSRLELDLLKTRIVVFDELSSDL